MRNETLWKMRRMRDERLARSGVRIRADGKIERIEQYEKPRSAPSEGRFSNEVRAEETFEEREDTGEVGGPVFCENLRERGYRGSGIKRRLNGRIWFLLDRGYTYRGIAYELNINKMTVYRHKCLYQRMK